MVGALGAEQEVGVVRRHVGRRLEEEVLPLQELQLLLHLLLELLVLQLLLLLHTLIRADRVCVCVCVCVV